MMELGIKPVYVFDGKPPDFKSGELEKRRALAQTARDELAKKRAEQTSVRPCRAVALAWRAAGRGPLA